MLEDLAATLKLQREQERAHAIAHAGLPIAAREDDPMIHVGDVHMPPTTARPSAIALVLGALLIAATLVIAALLLRPPRVATIPPAAIPADAWELRLLPPDQ